MALGWPPGCLLAAQTVALSGCQHHTGDPVHPSADRALVKYWYREGKGAQDVSAWESEN